MNPVDAFARCRTAADYYRLQIRFENDLTPADDALMGKLARVAAKIARDRGIAEPGWRSVVNVNREGGQLVFHVHLHCMGGRPMFWPPG